MPYPQELSQIQQVVEDHRQTLEGDGLPLVLAIYYRSQAAPDAECLFEVARHFAGGDVSGLNEMMQVEFEPTERYPLGGRPLRLTVSNPTECEHAVGSRWPEAEDLMAAVRRGEYALIYSGNGDPDGDRIAQLLHVKNGA